MSIQRFPASITASIAINTAISDAVSFGNSSGGLILTPAAWTAASIGFKVCATVDGTFVPLRDQAGNLVQVTGVITNAAGAYPLPDELFGSLYFKLWSCDAAGSDTNQTAARTLTVLIKA